MNECDNVNLIDFSIEDKKNEHELNAAEMAETAAEHAASSIVSPGTEARDSFDNNPFDCAQKMVQRAKDPFDVLEKEAHFKAHHSFVMPTVEVKLARLISLSDDDNTNSPTTSAQGGSDSAITSACSTIYHSALTPDLESESPPISMSKKLATESGSSSVADSGEGSASSTDDGRSLSANTKKAFEYRKRLLKLSISNSTFNSPLSRHMAVQGLAHSSDETTVGNFLSPILHKLSETNEHHLSTESPLKLVEDDLMSEEPPNFVDFEKDFDADLEMLNIPMLKELPSSVKQLPTELDGENKTKTSVENSDSPVDVKLPNLAAIRAKLQAKRDMAKDNQDVSLLIQDLKSIICDIGVVDKEKKKQAECLLETLSFALIDDRKATKQNVNKSTLPRPPPIVRQGTFDIDTKNNKTDAPHAEHKNASTSTDEEDLTQSNVSVQTNTPIEKVPDVMINSSATYDGETAADKEYLNLPEIEPVDTTPPSPLLAQTDLNEIIEQLSKILGQQHIVQQADGSNAAATGQSSLNPTVIVVMNNSQLPMTSNSSSTQFISYVNNSMSRASPDFPDASMKTRRRSQSLSTHDKVKIVQLNLPPPTPLPTNRPDISPVSPSSADVNDSAFKTPSRLMRRNSFSNATAYTPLTPINYRATAAVPRRVYPYGASEAMTAGTSAQTRRMSILETHHEGQQRSAVVRPMPLNISKPNLKQKVKSNTSTTSVLPKGPMKATMPVKKVVPTIKTSPPSPEANVTATHRSKFNSSMLPSSRMSYTSTPMPAYPSACSTPDVQPTSQKRAIGSGINHSRYSYIATTPNTKPSSSTAAAKSVLKRRTLAELKAKSPVKPRASLAAAAKTAIKSSSRVSPNTLKTSKKPSTMTQGKIPTRLSTRPSVSGSTGVTKNKENKQLL